MGIFHFVVVSRLDHLVSRLAKLIGKLRSCFRCHQIYLEFLAKAHSIVEIAVIQMDWNLVEIQRRAVVQKMTDLNEIVCEICFNFHFYRIYLRMDSSQILDLDSIVDYLWFLRKVTLDLWLDHHRNDYPSLMKVEKMIPMIVQGNSIVENFVVGSLVEGNFESQNCRNLEIEIDV